jgi:hypothetical protein
MKIPVFKIFKYSKRASIVATVAGLFVIFGGASAYAAKSNALPGSTLYPLKQAWEEGQMLLSFSPASKAQTQVGIAQDRIKAAQAVVSQTPAATSVAIPALQQAQQHLDKALTNTSEVTDPTQRQEIKKSISDAAAEAETELEHSSESESPSASDKQDIQNTSDQIKKVQDQASTGD